MIVARWNNQLTEVAPDNRYNINVVCPYNGVRPPYDAEADDPDGIYQNAEAWASPDRRDRRQHQKCRDEVDDRYEQICGVHMLSPRASKSNYPESIALSISDVY